MRHRTFFKQWLTSRLFVIGAIGLGYVIIELLTRLFDRQGDLAFQYLRHLLGIVALLSLLLDYWLTFTRTNRFMQWLAHPSEPLPNSITLHPVERLLSEQVQSLTTHSEQLQTLALQQYNEQLDFYTLWAHQIKTPITALNLLIDQLPSEQRQTSLFKQELFKIQQYTESVLHYLRMETFHQDLVLQQTLLEDLIRQTVKKYASFFIRQNIQLVLDDCHLDITTDPKWLTVVLEQLLSNALKYTPSGSIRFVVTGRTLVIQDTGIGIRQEDIRRVFERGFTGFNGRIHQQSSGLGLYLCQQITQKLGIQLQLESELGKGTTALLTFDEHPLVLE